MTDDGSTLTRLQIDVQLPHLWAVILQLGFGEELLSAVASACRFAYARGYHDGDYVLPFHLDQFDDSDIDLRLLEVWASVPVRLDERTGSVLAQALRIAWCRGFLDGSGEKPFGPVPHQGREHGYGFEAA